MQADSIFVKPVTVDNLLAITGQGALNSVIELDRSLSVELHKWNHRIDGVHILLVEDNHLNQVVARGMLVQAGATVDVLDNGLKAIERLAGETHYDIILMDVQMPVMDGCTAARKIRQDLKLTVPILAMTAGVLASEHALCIQSGMNDFISKPIDVEQMFTTIVRYLPSRDALKPVTPDAQEELVVSPENQPNQIFNPDPVLQVGENDAAYRNNMVELIRRTVQQSPLLLSDAEQAWKSGNIKESAKILHSMRSSLGMLGAMQFSTAAVDIEKALHNEAFDLLPPLFDSAQSSLELTCQVAQLWLKKQEH